MLALLIQVSSLNKKRSNFGKYYFSNAAYENWPSTAVNNSMKLHVSMV